MMMLNHIFVNFLAFFVIVTSLMSCSTLSMSPDGRPASDQLLVAVAVQDAIDQLNLEPLVENKLVSLEVVGHSNEIDYVNEVAKAYLLQSGAVINSSTDPSDLDIKLIIDSTGSDIARGGWGIPIILPSLTDGFSVTTINLIDSEEQLGMSKLWAYATDPDGNLVYTTSPAFSQHTVKNLKILGLSLGRTSNVDELKQIPMLDDVNIFSQ